MVEEKKVIDENSGLKEIEKEEKKIQSELSKLIKLKTKKYKGKISKEVIGFKEFLIDTNLMALAIGFLLGSSFRNVIISLINEVMIPLITGGRHVNDITIWELNIGLVLSSMIEFIITAFTVYIVYKSFLKVGLAKKK